MVSKVVMPRLTHDMTNGILANWLKSEGDFVEVGDPLFEVETDKAISEVVSSAKGLLRGVRFQNGDEIPIGTLMAYILSEGEQLPETLPESQTIRTDEIIPDKDKRHTFSQQDMPQVANRIVASPIARRIAHKYQIDLNNIKGSGPQGRIVEDDLWATIKKQKSGQNTEDEYKNEPHFSLLPLSRSQRAVGKQMVKSIQTIPQFNLEVEVDATEAQMFRRKISDGLAKPLSFTALLIKIVAEALSNHPEINCRFDGDHIRRYMEINIGVAVSVDKDLIVPVIHNANLLSFHDLHIVLTKIKNQIDRGKLESQNMGVSGITISNLGMYGIDRFQAIINPPEASILSVGRIRMMPWVKDGKLTMCEIVDIRLGVDHRVHQGTDAAPFLLRIKEILENPTAFFTEGNS